MLYDPSANIVYTHLIHMGISRELEEKIDNFYIAGCKSASPLLVIMGSNFGDKISLTFGVCIKDSLYTKEFAKVMDEEGVDYYVEHVLRAHL